MGTKKKKTQLKPVARGFATTSVPKKVVPTEDGTGEDHDSQSIVKEPEATGNTSLPAGNVSIKAEDASGSAAEVVDPSLQGLVDKLQDKTEKDIVRTIKAIEQERRFAETMSSLELDASLVHRVLGLQLDTERRTIEPTIDEPAERAVARMAVTYGVLRRLGFSEERVEECLQSIEGIDLEEAFDWLHLHCTEAELEAEKVVDSSEGPNTYPISVPSTPRAAQHAASVSGHVTPPLSLPNTPNRKGFPGRLDANAPTFIPGISSFYPLQEKAPSSAPVSRSESPTLRIGHHSSESSGDWDWSPADHPNITFVQLSMQISELTTHRQPGDTRDASFLRDLQRRLEEVKKDYLFDAAEAESQFRIERERADAYQLQLKLRGTHPTSPPTVSTPGTPHKAKTSHTQSSSFASAGKVDVFEDDDEEETVGMFELLEDMPATEITQSGTTVKVRDMALPKHWSGRTPKSVLAERVHKVDRFAAIMYADISGPSRAKRAKVDIRWVGGKTDSWSMDNVACHDMSQAEQYISTIALHALAFRQSEGFALGATAATNNQTAFRLLPAIHRDLWDELEKQRLAQDNAVNRDIWAKLQSMLEPKLKTQREIAEKSVKPTLDVKPRYGNPSNDHGSDLDSEQIMAGFQARQASPAYQDMLRQREQLPIAQHRNDIVSALETYQVLVLSGETGCGKSTQVPSFILEDHLSKGKHCKIYCTEPRRISAISLAQRVSRELGESAGAVGTAGSIVGYSIRLESNITYRTRLAYVTNGIALRMLEGGSGQGGQGTAFDEITHIIIDEVHERTIESDFLLIVLKSLLRERPELKVVLMSATVEAEKISNYFDGAPVLYVPGRTFPVDVRFLEDAVELTKWKLTEGSPYARRGNDKYSRGKARNEWSEDAVPVDDDDDETTQENVKLEKRYSALTTNTINLLDERLVPFDLIVRLLEQVCLEDPAYAPYSSAVLVFMPGMGEIRRLNDLLMEHSAFGSEDHFRVYALHSTISSEQQGAVFDIPPAGIRKIVIATNIAETGITIPDITCVIDTGKHREMRFDEKRQISRLVETFIAKSNAAQRRGRAGRVQSGLCFHLFTKIRHDTKLAAHPDPEMMRLSLSDLALRIKIMKVKLGTTIEDVLSRALDPPLSVNIQRAVSALVEVRALTPSEEITPMGRLLSKLPTDVHLGKFLLIATLFRCLDPALTIAATLNAKSPFITPMGLEQAADRAKMSFRVDNSDFLTIHNVFASWRRACANGQAQARKFCKESFLSYQNLQQIEELRQQFLGYLVDSSFLQVDSAFVRELSRVRYSRNRTRFATVPPDYDTYSGNAYLLNAALAAGLYPKILSINSSNGSLRTVSNNQLVAFHPSSINFGKRATEFGVNHLCYFTLMQSKKLYAWETGPVDDLAMVLLCGEPEFKLSANIVYIDRKIKFRFSPKTGIAVKLLRMHLSSLLSTQMRTRPLAETQVLWNELAMMVLGKMKPEEPGRQLDSITLVVNRPS